MSRYQRHSTPALEMSNYVHGGLDDGEPFDN
jgi:hypothetical protein